MKLGVCHTIVAFLRIVVSLFWFGLFSLYAEDDRPNIIMVFTDDWCNFDLEGSDLKPGGEFVEEDRFRVDMTASEVAQLAK